MTGVDHRLILDLTLREHIGGRWAISWQMFVLNMPFNIIGVVTVMAAPPTGGQWLGWLTVALLGLVVIGVFFIVGDLTWLRHRRERPVPVWSVALWGGLIGATRAGVVTLSAGALDLQVAPASDGVMRVAWGALLGAIALPLGALLLSSVSRFRHERERLLAERAAAERVRMQREGEVATLREALVEGVRGQVRQALTDVESGDLSAHEVSEAMRRTSHRIWSPEEETAASGAPVVSVLRASFAPHRIPALAIAVIWTVFAVPPLVTALGPAVAIPDLAFCFVALWACFALADRWAHGRPSQRWWALGVMWLIGWVLASPVSYLIFDRRPLEAAVPVFVVNAIWLALVVVLMTFLSGALASSEAVLRRLNEDLDDAEVAARAQGEERDLILRELAARLHGSVQSPMVSGVALLEMRGASEVERAHVIERVGHLVASLGEVEGERSLADGLATILAPWHGYLETDVLIEAGVEEGVDRRVVDRRVIERVVEEGVVNAYRHGSATRVSIEVRATPEGALIRVCDDGTGPVAGAPGLGSRFLSAVACQPWTLTASSSGGCCLEVVIGRPSSPAGALGHAD